MRFVSWAISLPLTLLFLLFILSNRESVTLTLWPFATAITAPLYLFFIATVIISFFIGSIVMWFGQHRHRAEARKWRKEAEALRAMVTQTPPVEPGQQTLLPPL
jgi:uncharacterized integral membrane protein